MPRSRSSQPVWHLLVLTASCLFFFDVFVRRVTVSFDWVPPLAFRNRQGKRATPRAALRFQPDPKQPADAGALKEEIADTAAVAEKRDKQQKSLTPEQEQEGYTERLLKAKKKVQGELKRDNPDQGKSETS